MKTVYLHTSEEVIKALKEGKEVHIDRDFFYKMIDGFIVRFGNGQEVIGEDIYISDNTYILEEDPFKIEVGKFYKTRDNKKAHCFFIDESDIYSCCFTIDNKKHIFCTKLNGEYQSDSISDFDIIGYWENK
ncbi:MAG: hypothetical protein NC222_07010 [Staphylococcus sp.]|nr:hypothetical protein [Staphylococcus sp.]